MNSDAIDTRRVFPNGGRVIHPPNQLPARPQCGEGGGGAGLLWSFLSLSDLLSSFLSSLKAPKILPKKPFFFCGSSPCCWACCCPGCCGFGIPGCWLGLDTAA